jgi:hypothetical protein
MKDVAHLSHFQVPIGARLKLDEAKNSQFLYIMCLFSIVRILLKTVISRQVLLKNAHHTEKKKTSLTIN